MASEAIGDDLAALVAAQPTLHSLIVTISGDVVFEHHGNRDWSRETHLLNSCTKTVLSALVGIAIANGVVGVHQSLGELLPDVPTDKTDIRLHHLLTMTSGIDWPQYGPDNISDRMCATDDWIEFILDQPAAAPPGQITNYSNGDSHPMGGPAGYGYYWWIYRRRFGQRGCSRMARVEGVVEDVLAELGVAARRCEPLKVVDKGNSSWRVETEDGHTLALRRYHRGATIEAVLYEHAVLDHVAAAGWAVPHPVTELVDIGGALFCATAFVPGSARETETPEDQAQRGRVLARLHLCLRDLDVGQRPGWRSQHASVTVHSDIDWERCVAALRCVDGPLADWAEAAAEATRAELARLGADDLPVMAVHGDFASWNVHYSDAGRLAGIVDFGLTHLDSRPYELAIGRGYRAPAMVAAYCSELANLGWPLTQLEEAALKPLQRAFRVDMAAWAMDAGASAGSFDLATIRSQLQRTETAPPT